MYRPTLLGLTQSTYPFRLKTDMDQTYLVVVAHLVDRSLPIPEVRGSNLVIGKKLY